MPFEALRVHQHVLRDPEYDMDERCVRWVLMRSQGQPASANAERLAFLHIVGTGGIRRVSSKIESWPTGSPVEVVIRP